MLTLTVAALAALLCIGDSITKAGPTPEPYCMQLGGINAGAPQTTTADWAYGGTFEAKAAPHLMPAQTVSVLLGANDESQGIPAAEFKANLETIIALASGGGRTIVLTPMWDTGRGTGLIEAYTAAILELVDAGAAELGPVFYFDPPDTPGDGIHPTQAGHDDMAERMRRYLPICVGDTNNNDAVGVDDFAIVMRHLGDQCF